MIYPRVHCLPRVDRCAWFISSVHSSVDCQVPVIPKRLYTVSHLHGLSPVCNGYLSLVRIPPAVYYFFKEIAAQKTSQSKLRWALFVNVFVTGSHFSNARDIKFPFCRRSALPVGRVAIWSRVTSPPGARLSIKNTLPSP